MPKVKGREGGLQQSRLETFFQVQPPLLGMWWPHPMMMPQAPGAGLMQQAMGMACMGMMPPSP
eukprot:15460326-Alexandrium_andersonii.AAC.1